MKILSAITVRNFLNETSCHTIHQSVLELEESWNKYNNRLSLGSAKELIDNDKSYKQKCLNNNPVLFEKFPSLFYKIRKMLNNIYVEEIEDNSYSIPGFEIIENDGTYFNLGHNADFYFTIPIHIGNASSGLFYITRFGNKKEYLPLYVGSFYFHVKPFHKQYFKLNLDNKLICLEGKGKINPENNKITLFF